MGKGFSAEAKDARSWLHKEGVKAIRVPSLKAMAMNAIVLEINGTAQCKLAQKSFAHWYHETRGVFLWAKDSATLSILILTSWIPLNIRSILYKSLREVSMSRHVLHKEPNKIFQRLFSGFIPLKVAFCGVARQIQWPSEVPHGCGLSYEVVQPCHPEICSSKPITKMLHFAKGSLKWKKWDVSRRLYIVFLHFIKSSFGMDHCFRDGMATYFDFAEILSSPSIPTSGVEVPALEPLMWRSPS